MIIDTHAHFVSPDLLDAARKERARFPSLRIAEEAGGLTFAFAGGKPTRPVSKPLSDVKGRIAWMDGEGIDRQIVGGWVDLFGYDLPPEEGEAWSELTNAALAALTRSERRLIALASVPMQDGQRAAAVLRRARAAGFPGVMIGTLPRGVGSVLDAPDLDPFWGAAHDTEAVVHIHPSFDAGDVRVNDYGMQNAVGRISDAVVAVTRLLYSGHVSRYRNAKIVVPMGGSALPFVLGRLARNHQTTPNIADPVENFSHLYFDTVVHDVRVLRFVIEMAGSERLMLGSDMPFPIGDLKPRKIVENAGLDADTVARINGLLAAKLFSVG